MSHLISTRRCLVLPIHIRDRTILRHGHAATRPSSHDDDMAESSSAAALRHAQQAEKLREKQFSEGYRFPTKGRRGGAPDPFEVLGVTPNTSDREIKEEFLRRAKILHPDGQHPEASTDRFATLKKAHTILSKPHTRAAYMQSGHGWTRDDHDPRSDPDWKMRQEVMFRNRVRRGFAEGGSGAWGGFDGERWRPNKETGFDMEFSAEPTYMSNPKFLGTLGLVAVILGWLQYHRLDMVTDTRKEMLEQSHLSASHALASARGEASVNSDRRRDMIRRRVIEARVLREVEKMENGSD